MVGHLASKIITCSGKETSYPRTSFLKRELLKGHKEQLSLIWKSVGTAHISCELTPGISSVTSIVWSKKIVWGIKCSFNSHQFSHLQRLSTMTALCLDLSFDGFLARFKLTKIAIIPFHISGISWISDLLMVQLVVFFRRYHSKLNFPIFAPMHLCFP